MRRNEGFAEEAKERLHFGKAEPKSLFFFFINFFLAFTSKLCLLAPRAERV